MLGSSDSMKDNMQQAFLMAAYVQRSKMGLQGMKEAKIQELSQRMLNVVRWHLASQGQTLGETGEMFKIIQESIEVTMNQVIKEMEEAHIDQLELLRMQYNERLTRAEDKNQEMLAKALAKQDKLREDMYLNRMSIQTQVEQVMGRLAELNAMTLQYGK